MKTYLDIDVNTAADQRMRYLFDHFEHICVSFSAGKDSTVLLDKAQREAARRQRTIDVLFIDWEAQYQATIDHAAHMLARPYLRPSWVCLPMSTSNESSFHDPMWTAWNPADRERWVRPMPIGPHIISDPAALPFYTFGMTFEEFVPAWNAWYAAARGDSAFLIGIRSDESLNRFRALRQRKGTKRNNYQGLAWSTQAAPQGWNFYPLYDWGVEDIWAYIGREGIPYNRIYDKMLLAGMKPHDMRICEPYSREARKHLDKYHQLEPETWERIVARASGVNAGAIYGDSSFYGYRKIEKPADLTWKEYAALLLNTMPQPLQDHYRRRITVFITWFEKHMGWTDLKEESDLDLEMRNLGGSWRMVCRTLLRNDYFCTHLSFGINKDEYGKFETLKEKYRDL